MRPSSISIAEDSDDSDALFFCGRDWHGYPVASADWGACFSKTQGSPTCTQVRLRYRQRNLAMAVLVSIDTAVQHCEVWNLVAGIWYITDVAVIRHVARSLGAHHWYSGGRHSRLCSHFAWVGGRVLFAFVVAININTGCWWLLWSNPPGLAQQAFARGSGVGYSAGGGALPSWW